MKKYIFIFKTKLKALSIIAILSIIISILSIVMIYIGGFFIDVLLEATKPADILWLCFVILCIGLYVKKCLSYLKDKESLISTHEIEIIFNRMKALY